MCFSRAHWIGKACARMAQKEFLIMGQKIFRLNKIYTLYRNVKILLRKWYRMVSYVIPIFASFDKHEALEELLLLGFQSLFTRLQFRCINHGNAFIACCQVNICVEILPIVFLLFFFFRFLFRLFFKDLSSYCLADFFYQTYQPYFVLRFQCCCEKSSYNGLVFITFPFFCFLFVNSIRRKIYLFLSSKSFLKRIIRNRFIRCKS